MTVVFLNWKRVLCLFGALFSLTLSLGAAEPVAIEPSTESRPNIILILADDLGFGDLGVYGADPKVISTLSVNRLYVEGRRYMNAYAPSAVCSPTRFSVLSGCYPWRGDRVPRHLNASEPYVFKDGEATLASLLKKAGYATACVGKWHLGAQRQDPINWNEPLKPGPNDAGFDYFFGAINSHNQAPYVWVENDQVLGRRPGETIEIKGNTEEVHGIEYKRRNVETAATLTQRAVRFMEENKDHPFFLYYPAFTVHAPNEPASFMAGKSKAGAYGDCVMEFDWQVSQILRHLGRLGLHEKTLIVVTSDNGALTGPGSKFGHKSNGDLRGQKTQIFDGGVHVPFIVRWPGKVPPASESRQLVSLADLPATLLAAAGVPMPDDFGPDSFNLLPDFLGEQPAGQQIRESLVVASKFQDHLAIRELNWKLIVPRDPVGDSPLAKYLPGKFGPGEPQLYNLGNDESEARDVFAQNATLAQQLAAKLVALDLQGFTRPGFKPSAGQ